MKDSADEIYFAGGLAFTKTIVFAVRRYRVIDPLTFSRKVCRPTATLHITRLAPELLATEGAIYTICAKYGQVCSHSFLSVVDLHFACHHSTDHASICRLQVVQFEIVAGSKSPMVLAEYISAEAGMHALMQLHNYRNDGNTSERGWIVSFTRSRVKVNSAPGATMAASTMAASTTVESEPPAVSSV